LPASDNPDQAVATFRHALSLREQLAASFEEENWQRELEAAYRRTSELILSMGRAPEALETAEQYLLATSLAPDQRADKPERVARALGTVCWSALFARDFHRALWTGREAVAITIEEEAAIRAALAQTPHATLVARQSKGAWSYASVWRVAARAGIALTAGREAKGHKRLPPSAGRKWRARCLPRRR
jgi:hypothetical protein